MLAGHSHPIFGGGFRPRGFGQDEVDTLDAPAPRRADRRGHQLPAALGAAGSPVNALLARAQEVRVFNTICYVTTERQEDAESIGVGASIALNIGETDTDALVGDGLFPLTEMSVL